jgi:hypothetical protein
MAISIQGGLYGALLYADTENASELPPALETCIGDNPGSALRGVGGVKRSTKAPAKDGAAKTVPKTPKRVFPEVTLPGLTNRKYPNSNIRAQFLQYLLQSTCETLAGGCPSRSSAAAKATGAVPKASRATPKAPTAKPPHAELAYARQPNTPLYEGCGIIISGPFYVTSKHKSKVEDTGMFELALATISFSDPVSQPVNRWPVVSPTAAKLRFTSKPEDGYAYREGTA